MATNFLDHVEWFKREVAVPGRFATLFPEVTDSDLAAAMVDGFWKARLDGWLPNVNADPDTFTTDTDLSMTAVALVIVYSGVRFVQNEIKNLPTHRKYDAPGGLSVETDYAPSVLTERLKELQAEKDDLLAQARRPTARPVYMHDGYAIRVGELYQPERMIGQPIRVLAPSELT